MAPKLIAKKQVAEDPHHTQAVQSYELGVRALQERKFEKAKGHLQKVLTGPNKSLCDRAKVHLQACDQHLERPALQFEISCFSVRSRGGFDSLLDCKRHFSRFAGPETHVTRFIAEDLKRLEAQRT